MSKARAEEYAEAPREQTPAPAQQARRGSCVIATTKPITGRTMTLPAGTRLVGAYRLADGRWVCQWNGRRLVVHGAPVVVGQRDETGRET